MTFLQNWRDLQIKNHSHILFLDTDHCRDLLLSFVDTQNEKWTRVITGSEVPVKVFTASFLPVTNSPSFWLSLYLNSPSFQLHKHSLCCRSHNSQNNSLASCMNTDWLTGYILIVIYNFLTLGQSLSVKGGLAPVRSLSRPPNLLPGQWTGLPVRILLLFGSLTIGVKTLRFLMCWIGSAFVFMVTYLLFCLGDDMVWEQDTHMNGNNKRCEGILLYAWLKVF